MKQRIGVILLGMCLIQPVMAQNENAANPSNGVPTADVNVVNTPLNPVPVVVQQTSSREAVLIEATVTRNEQGAKTLFVGDRYEVCTGVVPVCESGDGRYTVPEDKQLVIKHVSFRTRSFFSNPAPEPVGATLELLKSDPNGNIALSQSFQMGLLEAIDPALSISGKGFRTDITVPPGTAIVGRMTWSSFFDGRRDGQYSIAGEYVDVP